MSLTVVRHISLAIMFAFYTYTVAQIAYHRGEWDERDRAECICGETRPCPFGPGVVGVQSCGATRRWKMCEPDTDDWKKRHWW